MFATGSNALFVGALASHSKGESDHQFDHQFHEGWRRKAKDDEI
jgi:hypothetical protein